MSNLISSLLIEPVVRHARRFSSTRSDSETDGGLSHAQSRDQGNDAYSHAEQIIISQDQPLHGNLLETITPSDNTDDHDHIRDVSGNFLTLDIESGGDRATGIPEVARENGFQGYIPMDDIRSNYLQDENLSPLTRAVIDDTQQGFAPEPQQLDDSMADNFSVMSLDSGPPNQSSNPAVSISGGSQNESRMSFDSASVELAMSISRDGSVQSTMSGSLPADDGMKDLRSKIHRIREMALSSEEKARRMHALMITNYRKFKASATDRDVRHAARRARAEWYSQAYPSGSNSNKAASSLSMQDGGAIPLSSKDLKPTYRPRSPTQDSTETRDSEDNGTEEGRSLSLGCAHYMRNVKIQCADCSRWHTCRHCHDDAEDHKLERKRVENMLCMHCGTAQPAAETCKQCGEVAATYYCDICRLWDNDARKRIYHCPDCGICRRGEGLGKDYFHCKRCNVCISIRWADEHRCVERATECDCPICGEYMFTSSSHVVSVRCGHYMHKTCYKAYINTNYRCPMCSRSMVNMALQWRKLDDQVARQPMPAEYQEVRALISCNDCTGRSTVPYHWLALKCTTCDSYNTARLKLINMPGAGQQQEDTNTPNPTALPGVSMRSETATPAPEAPQQIPPRDPHEGLAFDTSRSPALRVPQAAVRNCTVDSAPQDAHALLAHSPSDTATSSSTTVLVSHSDPGSDEAVMVDAHPVSPPSSPADDDSYSATANDDDDDDDDLTFWGARSQSPTSLAMMSMPSLPGLPSMPANYNPSNMISAGWSLSPPSWMSPRLWAQRRWMGDADVESDDRMDDEDGSDEDEDEDEDEDGEDWGDEGEGEEEEEVDELELFGHR